VRTWVVPKTFGIILFVSDGMITQHLTAARLYEGGADHHLALESFPNLALLSNPAQDFAVPDDAAAATALATGVRVGHRHLAVDAHGKSLDSILELARKRGRAVGLITTGSPLSAAPAAFYAHTADSGDKVQILDQFLGNGKFDIVLGGGAGDFLPAGKGGLRKDNRDVLAELQGKGWEIVRSKVELENAPAYRTSPLAGFFSVGEMAFSNQIESGSQQPSLADMVRRAIQFLEVHSEGYVLVVDAGLATSAAERNEGERVITETLALDHAMATAAKYAGEKSSLILAVGKHGTGGFSLNGYPFVQDHGVALLGVNAVGQPAITWATGPNGPGAKTEPSAFQTPSGLNTAQDVVAVGLGAGAEKLRGFMENTQIFNILKDAL
jgi:alkaline phosphatase